MAGCSVSVSAHTRAQCWSLGQRSEQLGILIVRNSFIAERLFCSRKCLVHGVCYL
jgi:hypothetical protein